MLFKRQKQEVKNCVICMLMHFRTFLNLNFQRLKGTVLQNKMSIARADLDSGKVLQIPYVGKIWRGKILANRLT